MEQERFKGEVHNFRNDYRFKYELHQKANGEYQIDVRVQSDNDENLASILVAKVVEIKGFMKANKLKPVEKEGADD